MLRYIYIYRALAQKEIFRARLRGRNQVDRESPKRRFSRKTQIFADSPLLLEFKHLEGAGNRRFSQKTAGNRRLGSVTLGASPLARP